MCKIWDLYKGGLSIHKISEQLNIDFSKVESVIINEKLKGLESQVSSNKKLLDEIIILGKNDRIAYLENLPYDEKLILESQIKVRAKDRINHEDVVTIIWLIGELQLNNLSELLCRYSSSPNGNIQRITYSSMGKLMNMRFVPYLKMGCKNKGVQVRMYAIKSLTKYDFYMKEDFFLSLLDIEENIRNKELIISAIEEVQSGKLSINLD